MMILWWLFRPMRFVAEMVRATTTPKQIAFGIAIGMLAGLLPKISLLAAVFGLAIFVFNVNLPAGMLSLLLFSFLSQQLDQIAHGFGIAVLQYAPLEPIWTWILQQPGAPWLRLNNTVVCGHLVLGLLLFYPIYLLTRRLSERCLPWLTQRVEKYRLYRVLFGADLATTWRFE